LKALVAIATAVIGSIINNYLCWVYIHWLAISVYRCVIASYGSLYC